MPPEGFEPAIPISEWRQTLASGRPATGIGSAIVLLNLNNWK